MNVISFDFFKGFLYKFIVRINISVGFMYWKKFSVEYMIWCVVVVKYNRGVVVIIFVVSSNIFNDMLLFNKLLYVELNII